MRICEGCRKPDSCIVDYETKCKPNLCHPTADERAETHHDNCPKLTHEVRPLYRATRLIHTPKHPDGQLEPKWIAEGWRMKRDGKDVFRVKMLCRACIQAVYEREERHKEYVKACKKAAGHDDRTYSQLLVMQSAI
jgi:hypothetical protein